MRRQTAISGINPAGSGRVLRPDPLSLPFRFDAHDIRADGGIRQIELHRERVILRRAVLGMRMAINVRVSDFSGIALREFADEQVLVLLHRDPSLTIPLCTSSDRDEIAAAWQLWSDIFALPQLTERKAFEFKAGGFELWRVRALRVRALRARAAPAAPQRGALAPSEIPDAQARGDSLNPANVHHSEREIIARD